MCLTKNFKFREAKKKPNRETKKYLRLPFFLGGSLYSLDILPEFWQIVTYFNPVVYLINGLRFSFYGVSDFNIWISVGLMLAFLAICIAIVTSLLKKGYNIKA